MLYVLSKYYESYYEQLQELSKQTGIPQTQDWLAILMRLPETLKTEVEELDENEWNEILKTINEAVNLAKKYSSEDGASFVNGVLAKLAD